MTRQSRSFWGSWNGWAAIALIAAVSYFLFVEHREHVFEYLPLLILLLCPVMHIFMHRGHSHHQGGSKKRNAVPPSDLVNDAFQKGLKEGRRQAKKSALSEENKDERGE